MSLDGEHPQGQGSAETPQARAHRCCAVRACPAWSHGPWLGSGSPCSDLAPSVASRRHSPEGGPGMWGLSTAPTAPLLGLLRPTRASPSPQNHCRGLPSLCRSSCRVLALISATWRSWASSSSCGGCCCPCSESGCRGGSPCGTRGSAGRRGWPAALGLLLPALAFRIHCTSTGSLLEVGLAVRSRALSWGVSTSPRGAPRTRPGPCCPHTAGGTPRGTK